MFDIGYALPVIFVLFLCTIFALNRLLFRPLQAVLDERERLSTGTLQESGKTLERSQELFESYRRSVKQAQAEGYQHLDAVRSEVAHTRAQRLAEARLISEATLARMREEIASQVEEAKEQLRKDAEELSGTIAALVLQKSA